MSQTPDYATWPTKQQAAEAIGVTTKTVERLAQEGQLQQARWRRPTGGPELAVYHPADVARLAAARRPGPPAPFLVPATAGAGAVAGNGHHSHEPEALVPVPTVSASGEELLRALVTAAVRVMSETSQTSTLFVTLQEAAALSGLSQTHLRRRIADGTLPAIRDRGWRIRRRDLETL
jgi:excisionase family DNA binding protein